MKKRFLLLFSVMLMALFSINAQAASKGRIVWCSYVNASDAGYITALQNAGYTVRNAQEAFINLPADSVAVLNTYDLVIISKNANSVHYSSGATAANWNKVTVPVINMNNYANRTSRLGFFNTTVNESPNGTTFVANNPTHPIFKNIALDAANITAVLNTVPVELSGTSDVGNGTLIATSPGLNRPAIVEWPANTAFYTGGLSALGKRLWYAASNGYSNNAAGNQLFLNAVEYMIYGRVLDKTKKNIAWLGNNLAADKFYFDELGKAGYNVIDKTATKGDLTPFQLADLNSYDLVILSRSLNSGDYNFPTKYDQITTPFLCMANMAARNTRLRMFAPGNVNDPTTIQDVLEATDLTHPIFNNLNLTAANTIDIAVPGVIIKPLDQQKSAGNGKLIGVTSQAKMVLVAEWDANQPYYEGSVDIMHGKRMVYFNTQGSNTTGDPMTSNLSENGYKLLNNIAEYMTTGNVVRLKKKITFITENAKADSLYVDLLTKNNCDVKVVTNLLNVAPSDSAMTALESSDVIIFSRNTTSGGYQALTQYNGLKTPIMLMSAYMARNSRWQVFNTGTAVDNDASKITVANSAHSIFKGITIDPLTPLAITTTQKAGACDIKNAGNGTVLATSETGKVVIAEWNKKTMFYSGSASVPQGHRMVFFLTNAYDLTPDAEKLYVNAVNYLSTFDSPAPETTKVTLITEDAVGDKPYIDLLKANKFEVNVVSDLANVTPSDAQLAALEASNVILFSKNVSTGAYQSLANYNRLATPVMLMSNFMARTSRWQVLETEGTVDNDDNMVTVQKTSHPIFAGVTLGESDALDLTTTKKIGTCDITTAGNGTVLATAAGSGNVVIAEWARATKFYSTSTSSAGHRMVFFTTAAYDLTSDAQKVFINAVKYLANYDYTTYLNNHPTDIMLTNNAIDEGMAVGTVVGTLSGADPDAGATLTFSLVAGQGNIGADNALFEITGTSLKTKAAFDFEDRTSYSVNVQVSDGQLTFTKAFVVTINNVFETGVKELLSNNVSVYPNPFADVVYINSKIASDATISIYTITGQVVYKKSQILSNKLELKIDLPKGMYIMNIDGEKVHYSTQLMRK